MDLGNQVACGPCDWPNSSNISWNFTSAVGGFQWCFHMDTPTKTHYGTPQKNGWCVNMVLLLIDGVVWLVFFSFHVKFRVVYRPILWLMEEIMHQLIVFTVSHYLRRWCRISSKSTYPYTRCLTTLDPSAGWNKTYSKYIMSVVSAIYTYYSVYKKQTLYLQTISIKYLKSYHLISLSCFLLFFLSIHYFYSIIYLLCLPPADI